MSDNATPDLLYRSWLGLRVLSHILKKMHGTPHAATEELLAEIEAAHPEFAPRSAIRAPSGGAA